MNKKSYIEPATRVMKVQTISMIAISPGGVSTVGGNAELGYGGGSSGAALSRDGGWDEDDE